MSRGDTNWQSPTAALTRFRPYGAAATGAPGAQGEGRARFAFRIGGTGFLVDRALGAEVVRKPVVFELPNTPTWFAGLVSLRGDLVPAFDLADALGHAAPRGATRALLVLGRRDEAAGLLVDEPPRPLRGPAPLPEPPAAPALLEGRLEGAFEHEGRLWLDVDFPALLAALAACAD